MSDKVSFPAYAYEVQAGDEIDGKTVTKVAKRGQKVTVTFGKGDPLEMGRTDEVQVTRARAAVAAWNGEAPGTPAPDTEES